MPANLQLMIGVGIIVVQSFLIGYLWLLLERKNKAQKDLKISKLIERYKLTARQGDVIKELAGGKSTKEIAEILFISPDTVKGHRKAIYKSLEIGSLNEFYNLLNNTKVE